MFAPATRPPSLLAIVLMTAVALLSLNMILPSLPTMAADFGITYAEASLAISAFMMVTAGLQLVIGPLSDIYGRRPIILASVAIFALASLGCALAPDFGTFMVFRIIQAAIVGAQVIPRAMIRDVAPPQQATANLATVGMVLAIAPMFAPMVGGALDQVFGWRANFHLFFLMALGILWLAWTRAGETNSTRGGGFIAHFRGYPLLLADRGFWSYAICLALSVGVYFAYLTGTPLVATESFGLTGALLGLSLGVPAVGFLVGNWLSNRLAHRLSMARMILAGRLATLAGMCAALALWLVGAPTALSFYLFMPLIGLGNGLSIPAGSVGVMSVRPELAGSAAGISGALIVGGGALMTTVTGVLLSVSHDPLRLLVLLVLIAALATVAIIPAVRAERGGPPP